MAFLRLARLFAGLAALVMIGAALSHFRGASTGLVITPGSVGTTPVTVWARADSAPGPVVVIAHGFAGSQQIMAPFAITLARAGYVAVTFDFAGHGSNPMPLGGSITDPGGATAVLLSELQAVIAWARPQGDGRLATVGHSMATDILVRAALADPGIAATVAVSMFSLAVTAQAPRNLLMVAGQWEGALVAEALRVLRLNHDGAVPGVIYVPPRQLVIAPAVEHIGVLFSRTTLVATTEWLNSAFGFNGPVHPELRGAWIGWLIGGVGLLAWPLVSLLPRLASPGLGAGDRWHWPAILLPVVLTPLILWRMPSDFLPVLVGDYLAVHFALYGALTGLLLWWSGAPRPGWVGLGWGVVLGAVAILGLGGAIHLSFTNFVPHAGRIVLVAAILAGVLPYFLADEWLTRGARRRAWLYAATKLGFLASLALAVALNREGLFFLVLLIPVIVLFFLLFGTVSGWVDRRTGSPMVAAVGNALMFAWAIAVTFPQVSG